MTMNSIGTPELWFGFTAFVLMMLVLDLGLFHRRPHALKTSEALVSSAIWILLALAFNAGIFFYFGKDKGVEFLTGYLIEETLSVDNLFVFLMLFTYFEVPAKLQHRVLFWGILGAIVMRAIFIFLGAALVQAFHWVMYIFGGFLIMTAIKMLTQKDEHVQPERNPVMRFFSRFVPMVPGYRGKAFLVKENGRWFATPLLMVLVMIEASDVLFAVDSIPAIFAISTDPFIIYSSNIFAVLGLRSLYFLLANMMEKFHYLKVGLGLILGFVGTKMLIENIYHIPIVISLLVIMALLAGSAAASMLWPPKK